MFETSYKLYSQLVPKVNSYQVNSYPSQLVPTVNSYPSQLVPTVNSYLSQLVPKVNSYPNMFFKNAIYSVKKTEI